jgi:general nucleoside transport system ATP-binding protein
LPQPVKLYGLIMAGALKLAGISKSFDGFRALSGVDLSVQAGEVHALLGENGAGKSTLMNIAAGLYRPDEGSISVRGREVVIAGPLEAKRLGIGMVHQHYKLTKGFNAVENILLTYSGSNYAKGLAEIEGAVRRQCEALNFKIDLKRPVGSLSISEQQRIEIIKVLVGGADILILDEPTAVLTDREAQGLLDVMRQLAGRGATVILVTHKLGEVISHADTVSVMRGGRSIVTTAPKSLSLAELTTLVVGAEIRETPHSAQSIGEPVLTLTGVAGCRDDGHRVLSDASFELRRGEIFGIAGVGGNGQTELAEILMGVRQPVAGQLTMAEAGDITAADVRRRRELGLVAIPGDRHTYGLANDLSITDNYAVNGVLAGKFGSWARVDRRSARARTGEAVNAFDVQGVRSLSQKAALLSGGNAQKLVIAREFATKPRIVLAQSPSRGLDLRASSEVHRRLLEARDNGAGVLLISEDLDEILLLSDRIGVMSRGRIVAEFKAPGDRLAIGAAMVHHA